MNFRTRSMLAAMSIVLIAGCAVGPNYKRPQFNAVANYKEIADWKPSEPENVLQHGAWWEIYGDPVLNDLEQQINVSNENVKAAFDAVEQAQALLRESKASFWPTLTASASRQFTTDGSNVSGTGKTTTGVSSSVSGVGTWSLDFWGQTRRAVEGAHANAQASEAALALARLTAQAQLASAYFQLRAQDHLQILFSDTVTALQKSLSITESRYHFGVAAKADVVSAQTQLLNSQSQQVNEGIQRAVLEHAIAVLVGKQPADLSLTATTMRVDVPTVPTGLPSTLLERRPDIAEAERKVAAANAQIGVARAAFFPAISLSASDDYRGSSFSKLITAPNQLWAWGPALTQSLFAGGLHVAQAQEAKASFNVAVDNYRQTVLAAFQQVEDQIVTLRILEKQAVIEDSAVKAAKEAEALTLNQYKAGVVPYSSVITAQMARLSSEETALTVLTNRLTASVTMIEALGGGWSATELH